MYSSTTLFWEVVRKGKSLEKLKALFLSGNEFEESNCLDPHTFVNNVAVTMLLKNATSETITRKLKGSEKLFFTVALFLNIDR